MKKAYLSKRIELNKSLLAAKVGRRLKYDYFISVTIDYFKGGSGRKFKFVSLFIGPPASLVGAGPILIISIILYSSLWPSRIPAAVNSTEDSTFEVSFIFRYNF